MSTELRPLSTGMLCTLELRDLNPADTLWLAFNYYVQYDVRAHSVAVWYTDHAIH